jgi:hypothetical protein
LAEEIASADPLVAKARNLITRRVGSTFVVGKTE